jgi:DNA polymerase-4
MKAESVARELRKKDLRAKTITLKIKHADFKQATRSITLPAPTQSSKTIYKTASKLLEAYRITTKVRLIGVGASGLVSASVPVQMDIFENAKKRSDSWEKVDRTVDTITQKFGKDVIKRGTLSDK